MFESIAKRQLEKDVARLVVEKGAVWYLRSESVQTQLLQNHPKQQLNIQTLCHVVKTGSLTYLLSVPNPATDQTALTRAQQKVQLQLVSEKEAKWAVQCWATAISALPHQQRVELLTQLKTRAEASRQASAAAYEQSRIDAAEQQKHRIEAERQQKILDERAKEEAQRRAHLVECWRLAFPKEASAIDEAAVLASEAKLLAQKRAKEQEEANSFVLGQDVRDGLSKKQAAELAKQQHIRQVFENAKAATDAEIWRRIQIAPDQESMKSLLEEAWKVEVKRRTSEAERQRLKSEFDQKIKLQQEEHQRMRQMEEERRHKIQSLRERFPIQCAGLSDEEILAQINGAELETG